MHDRIHGKEGATRRSMKAHLSRINPVAVCCAMAATLAVAYGIWGYLDYFVPGHLGCSGDPACLAEITAERRADFVVVNIGTLLAFVVSFGGLLLALGIFVAIRDRWSWRT